MQEPKMQHKTPDETDDEWLTDRLFPLTTNRWFDQSERTC
jgi:hypothetical protein